MAACRRVSLSIVVLVGPCACGLDTNGLSEPTSMSSDSGSDPAGSSVGDSEPVPTSSPSPTSSSDDPTTAGEVTTQEPSAGTTTTTSNGSTTTDDTTSGSSSETTAEPPPVGACRASEMHGSVGGFPQFSDPVYAPFLDKVVAVMTTNAQDLPVNHVLHVVDISGPAPPPGLNYAAPKYRHSTWTQANLGRVFGLTIDSDGNIYVAATTVYGANPQPGDIKRIDGTTGAVTTFATLPNEGPALGNLNYDCVSATIYVSSHEDGRIYQLDMGGQVVSTYRHTDKSITNGPAVDPGEPDGEFTPLGDARVWAVQSHAGRLYYSVWKEDTGRTGPSSNEVWSVAYLDEGGVPDTATAKLEFLAPNYTMEYSNPIADISFAATGGMLISQRTMLSDSQSTAHQSTTYEYEYDGGVWKPTSKVFIIGELQGSSTGGVDHDFSDSGYVWMTGDALDFYTPNVVFGLQGTPYDGGSIDDSTLIDTDDELMDQDKTEQGDVEIPIPDDAMPVPPPG